MDKDIKTITDKDKIPSHDFHNHLVSLPRIFYKKNKNFPASVNFIKENIEVTKKWNDIFNKYTGIKVGINSHATTIADKRRIPIENFKQVTS